MFFNHGLSITLIATTNENLTIPCLWSHMFYINREHNNCDVLVIPYCEITEELFKEFCNNIQKLIKENNNTSDADNKLIILLDDAQANLIAVLNDVYTKQIEQLNNNNANSYVIQSYDDEQQQIDQSVNFI
jgi:hypothetical protein